MTAPNQRRGFIRREFSAHEVYAELDYIHQILNGYEQPTEVFQDTDISVYARRVSCMRAGLSLYLPVLKEEQNGWVVFIQDRSGAATGSPISIIAPPGFLIHSTASSAKTLSIGANYGKATIQWDFKNNAYYEI